MTIRKYGKSPCRAVVLHGGPGAIGSAAELARGISEQCGIASAEPFQSKYSIDDLISELAEQLEDPQIEKPAVLIGHSWGAFLALLFAERHPGAVRKLILTGSGALRPENSVDALRESRFSPEEAEEYHRLLNALKSCGKSETDGLLRRLGTVCERADTFSAIDAPSDSISPVRLDSEMFAKIWSEAVELRNSGELEKRAARLRIPVAIIHGDYDPHPPDGVKDVLESHGIVCSFHLLKQCGHSPWREKDARNLFFRILADEITG